MKSFPMFFRTTGRKVVIAGGGEQAAQKARLLLKTDAKIVLLAPQLDPELLDLVRRAWLSIERGRSARPTSRRRRWSSSGPARPQRTGRSTPWRRLLARRSTSWIARTSAT